MSYQPGLFGPEHVEVVTSDSWCTPRWLVELVMWILGRIDLDPCSNPRSCVEALQSFDVATDGLSQAWRGRVYCNPPYSNPEPWMRRCFEHYQGTGLPVVALVKGDWSTQWWQRYVRKGARCELARRVKFDRPDKPPMVANFPSALVYWGSRPRQDFEEKSKDFGEVVLAA